MGKCNALLKNINEKKVIGRRLSRPTKMHIVGGRMM